MEMDSDWNFQSSSSSDHEICLPVHDNLPNFAHQSSPMPMTSSAGFVSL